MEKPIPMTPAQRRANWWHYHWKHVLAAGLTLVALCGAAWERVHRVEPDCCVAMVTRFTPTPDEMAAFQAALETVGTDTNGDGRVCVQVSSIQIDYTSTSLDDAAVMAMKSNVDKLNADFYTHQSGIFLLDDPERFQQNHQALTYLDGTQPSEGALDWENMTLSWADCPAVESVRFQGSGDTLWFGRRVASTETEQEAFAGAQALWECLSTAGAKGAE